MRVLKIVMLSLVVNAMTGHSADHPASRIYIAVIVFNCYKYVIHEDPLLLSFDSIIIIIIFCNSSWQLTLISSFLSDGVFVNGHNRCHLGKVLVIMEFEGTNTNCAHLGVDKLLISWIRT